MATQKKLLLKDLCSRLPYGVKVHIIDETGTEIDDELTPSTISHLDRWIVKPYLRPWSYMTHEEIRYYNTFPLDTDRLDSPHYLVSMYNILDRLLEHHIDFRGLIEKGLALEASKDMYKQEQPEVDLEKKIRRYLCEECSSDDEPTIAEIARHFYELGLNARKKEEL